MAGCYLPGNIASTFFACGARHMAKIVTVHGTFAHIEIGSDGSSSDAQKQWWQPGSTFEISLKNMVSPILLPTSLAAALNSNHSFGVATTANGNAAKLDHGC